MKTVITVDNGAVSIEQDGAPVKVTAPPRPDGTVGPFDLFTGPWKKGDRDPTEGEQTFHREWFLEFGKDQPPAQTGGATSSGGKVPFSVGGKLPLPYPVGTQKQWELTGVAAGMCALALGRLGAGKHPGGGYLSLTGATLDTCPIVRTAWATEAGVFVGPSILGTPGGATNRITAHFVAGQAATDGTGPQLPTDKDVFFNVEFGQGVPANVLAQIAAHDR